MTKDEAHASWRLNQGLLENYTTTSEAIEITRKIIEILQDYTQIEVLPEENVEKDLKNLIEKIEEARGMGTTDIIDLYPPIFGKLYSECWLALIDSCFRIYDTYKNITEKGGLLLEGWDVDVSEDFLSIMVKHYMTFNDFQQLLKISQDRSHRVL